ncbi:abortive infection family protein [Jhaorihella thermophila]
MTADWFPGIRAFCAHWSHAPMLQQTFQTLESEFQRDSDACIDAAKGLVECACRLLIEELDDPVAPLKPTRSDVPLGELLGLAVRTLELGEVRHRAFANLIREHNKLADALRILRNEGGTVSHGKDGFIAKLSAHHRRASVLAADAIVTFLHEAYLEREPDPVLTLEPYDRFAKSNALIDEKLRPCGKLR